jgi:hypothetical protein
MTDHLTRMDRRRFLGALVASVAAAGVALPVGMAGVGKVVLRDDIWAIELWVPHHLLHIRFTQDVARYGDSAPSINMRLAS